MMRIGIAADHGGFESKVQLTAALKAAGYEVADFGAHELVGGDDYPDFVVPMARAVARGEVSRGLAICSSISIEKADGFTQVFPKHKFHIVDVLQKHGHIVGMTGDRVNGVML